MLRANMAYSLFVKTGNIIHNAVINVKIRQMLLNDKANRGKSRSKSASVQVRLQLGRNHCYYSVILK